jgi:ATP-dependent DNA helicase RecG
MGDRVADLLFHFPVSIIKRVENIKDLAEGDKLTAVVDVIDHIIPLHRSRPYKIVGAVGHQKISILYFNYKAHYMKKMFPIGSKLTISGSAKIVFDEIEITHPDIVEPHTMFKYHVGVEPVYSLTAGLSNKTLRYVINSLIKQLPNVDEWIPENMIAKYSLVKFCDAIRALHTPKSMCDIISENNPAKKRLAIDELLANQIKLKKIRTSYAAHPSIKIQRTNRLLGKLNIPFELTDDQRKCIAEIEKDFSSDKQMNRLIQGDVGVGKTIVAFISMLIAAENNFQSVLLAPTEILAIQHYNTILKLSSSLDIKVDIMLGSNRKIREIQIENLKSGKTNLLIGTHAVLENEIWFKNLGLIVIDEQHRFGVMQRLKLIKKCNYPNILAMSATPIPRTLMLGCYGDLDVSIMKHKPVGRKPIETSVVNISKIGELIERLSGINSQVYWVCPVIEESEKLVDVTARSEYLNKIFSQNDVKILHGKMKSQEKEEIINSFKRNEFKILVSTTVIEVGVDIPNANVIVIEHAERFGLAQLHQLRGRVGRGNENSHCILLYHFPISDIARKRLKLLKDSDDGFLISEEDLKMRGAGDILGTEQSGFDNLRFSDFSSNFDIIKIADEIVSCVDISSNQSKLLCNIFGVIYDDIVA